MFVFFLVLLFRTNVELTLITLGVAMLTLGGFQLIGRLQRRQASQSYRTFGQFMTIAQEALTSIRVVKAFGAEDFVVERFRQAATEFARLEAQREIVRVHVPDSLSPVLNVVTLTVLAAAGSREVAAGQLSQEGLLLFLGVTVLMFASAVTIGNSVVGVYETVAASERVLDLLRNRPEVVDGTRPVPGFRRALALRHVHFSYGEQFRLRDIGLELREGERLAIVGPSGSGKSTIIDLILRLYDPTDGVIELDGEDIREFKLDSYRRLFGVVSQESLLFNDTVRNNIAYGRPELSEEAIREAARIANADEFIEQLPQGYDTLAGDRGTRLSGGQRQRVAIARALASRPRLLVLDEATSSLDSESERQVQQALEAATRNVTTLIVAHRLSTVQMADKIVVLDNGSIVETGTHGALLAHDGLYRHLYEAQMGNGHEASFPLASPTS
jgi:subfamily B ATP-binding cassette protein MsbA